MGAFSYRTSCGYGVLARGFSFERNPSLSCVKARLNGLDVRSFGFIVIFCGITTFFSNREFAMTYSMFIRYLQCWSFKYKEMLRVLSLVVVVDDNTEPVVLKSKTVFTQFQIDFINFWMVRSYRTTKFALAGNTSFKYVLDC